MRLQLGSQLQQAEQRLQARGDFTDDFADVVLAEEESLGGSASQEGPNLRQPRLDQRWVKDLGRQPRLALGGDQPGGLPGELAFPEVRQALAGLHGGQQHRLLGGIFS